MGVPALSAAAQRNCMQNPRHVYMAVTCLQRDSAHAMLHGSTCNVQGTYTLTLFGCSLLPAPKELLGRLFSAGSMR